MQNMLSQLLHRLDVNLVADAHNNDIDHSDSTNTA